MAIGRLQYQRMKIGIIGLGNVGLALGKGLKQAGHQDQTLGCDRNLEKRQNFTQTTGFSATENWEELVTFADLVLVCIRHGQVQPFLEQLRDRTHSGKTIVCLAAAVTSANLKKSLAPSLMSVVRAITNVNVASRCGLTMIMRDSEGTPSEINARVVELFEALGEVLITESEAELDSLSVLSGCGPAVTAIFLEGLTEFGIRAGFDPSVARDVAVQCASASLMTLSQGNPDLKTFKYSVAAPGGIVDTLLGGPESRAIETSIVEWFDYIRLRILGKA
jgi:pyrroline-5-carboxylate reductase